MAGYCRVRFPKQGSKKVTADEAGRARQEDAARVRRRTPDGWLEVRCEDSVPRQIGSAARPALLVIIEIRGQVLYHRRHVDAGDREIRLDCVADAAAEADGEKRMATEIEEIVVDADPRHAKRLREQGADQR